MFAKVRITTNEIKKYVEEFTRKMSFDIRKNRNNIQSNRRKILKLEKEIKELQEECITCRCKKN